MCLGTSQINSCCPQDPNITQSMEPPHSRTGSRTDARPFASRLSKTVPKVRRRAGKLRRRNNGGELRRVIVRRNWRAGSLPGTKRDLSFLNGLLRGHASKFDAFREDTLPNLIMD